MDTAYIKNYRDFWDFPRIFLVSFNDSLFLFDCKFNEKIEDFEEKYQVFIMPELTESEINGSWYELSNKAVKYLGEVLINNIQFDKTRKQFINGNVLTELTKHLV